ncbi:unnamed protein product, partial [Rotaria magnacalcarata]
MIIGIPKYNNSSIFRSTPGKIASRRIIHSHISSLIVDG